MKRGVSPLIATVLLLAFAVSIAAIVVQLDILQGGCKLYTAEIPLVDGKEKFCFSEQRQTLEISIQNKGYAIKGFHTTVFGQGTHVDNFEIDTNFTKNEGGVLYIPYKFAIGGIPTQIRIAPHYEKGNTIVDNCVLEIGSIKELDPCPS